MGLSLQEMACIDMPTFGLLCDEWSRMHGGAGKRHDDETRAATQADIDRIF